MKYALFLGCTIPARSRNYELSARKVANELGLDWRTRGDYGGAAQEIRIRGMNADGTQVLINGMVVNSPSLGSADVGKIPLNNIAIKFPFILVDYYS